jgi:hypothetical protein
MIATFSAVKEMPQASTGDGRWGLAKPVVFWGWWEIKDRIRTAWWALRGRGVLVVYADEMAIARDEVTT